MVVLTVVVVIKVWPGNNGLLEKRLQTVGSEEETAEPDKSGQSDGQQTVARVGAVNISATDLKEQLYKQYGDTVLRTMMVRKAIDLEAAASKISVSSAELDREVEKMTEGYDSETRYFEMMQEQLSMTKEQVLEDLRYKLLLEKIAIRSIDVPDTEVDRYIAEHSEEYTPHLQLHLQWILTESEKEADSVLQLVKDGEDFTLLARTYSIDSFTAEAGGDLGLIDANDPFYNRDLLDTASRLQIAETAGPIKVDGGFAVIRLIERQMTTTMTDRMLKDEVRKQLALERADSLTDLEDKLMVKYKAVKTERHD
jgi:foldase protein PrsA